MNLEKHVGKSKVEKAFNPPSDEKMMEGFFGKEKPKEFIKKK